MKKIFLGIIGVFIFASILQAKQPGQRSFNDDGDHISVEKVYVGSMSATKLYTPSLRGDERGIEFYNPSFQYRLHVASFPITDVSSNSLSYVLDIASNTNCGLSLQNSATIYLMYEKGASSDTIKAIRKYQP